MEKNRREFSRNMVLAKPSNGLTPKQNTVSIRQSPNRSGRGIRINTPTKSMVLPPRRKGQTQQTPMQEYPEQQYIPEEYGYDESGYIEEDYQQQ